MEYLRHPKKLQVSANEEGYGLMTPTSLNEIKNFVLNTGVFL